MDNASIQFIAFGLGVALLMNLSRARIWRSLILLAASLVLLFLLAVHPVTLLPLAGFLALGFVGLKCVERGVRRAQVISVLLVLLAYIWLKKYTFLPEASFLHVAYFTLGLSYIFFRVLHLLIESGESTEHRRVSLFHYLLYTLNFTTLVSGPIQRYDEFARDQFAAQPAPLNVRVVGLQGERIIRGFFKVNVLALLLHAMQDDALADLAQPLPLSLKLLAAFKLAVLYPFFLYANFSGYIDIVIALARLMRLQLPENFDRPFSAGSVLEFWNRWHMTLSNWLKVYVYNPLLLALMRRNSSLSVEPFLAVFCFFVTFFLIGLWHGRTSEFIVYGLLTGGGISVNKLWQILLQRRLGRKGYKALAANFLYHACGRGLNFTWFSLTLFLMWSDWAKIHTLFAALSPTNWIFVWLSVWLAASVTLAVWEALREALLTIRTAEGPVLTSRYARVVYASALGLMAVVLTLLLNQPAPAIVYKAF